MVTSEPYWCEGADVELVVTRHSEILVVVMRADGQRAGTLWVVGGV